MGLYMDIEVAIPTEKTNLKKTKSGIYVEYFEKGKWVSEKGYALNKKITIGKWVKLKIMNPNDNYYLVFHLPPPKIELTTHRVVKDVGDYHLIRNIAKNVSMDWVLDNTFESSVAKRILTIAHKIIATGSSTMSEINEWLYKTLSFCNDLSDKRASELFASINQAMIYDFFELWISKTAESGCIFYDSTTTSSYSETINLFDYGYNKDKDGLQTIGIALFVGEKTHLPVFYEVYNGSINDKKQLQSMITKALKLGLDCKRFVMDRGYYSIDNVKFIHNANKKYIVCLQTGFLFVQEMINANPYIDKHIENRINNRDIYGARIKYREYGDVYLYYSNTRRENDINKMEHMFAKINQLFNEQKELSKDDITFLNKYCTVVKTSENQIVSYTKNNDLINQEMKTFGYFAFMSNDESLTPSTLLEDYHYRTCDEQFFDTYKNELDFFKNKVHNSDTLIGKIFVGFIGLILKAKMDLIIKEYKTQYHKETSDAQKKMLKPHGLTAQKIVYYLSSIRACNISGDYPMILTPITKKQKQIYEIFGTTEEKLDSEITKINFGSMW